MPTNVRCKLLTKINIPFARVKKYVGQETAHTFNLTQIHTHTHKKWDSSAAQSKKWHKNALKPRASTLTDCDARLAGYRSAAPTNLLPPVSHLATLPHKQCCCPCRLANAFATMQQTRRHQADFNPNSQHHRYIAHSHLFTTHPPGHTSTHNGPQKRKKYSRVWHDAHKVTNSHTDWIMVVNRIGDIAAWPGVGQVGTWRRDEVLQLFRCMLLPLGIATYCSKPASFLSLRPMLSHVPQWFTKPRSCQGQSSSVTAIAFKVFTLRVSLPFSVYH